MGLPSKPKQLSFQILSSSSSSPSPPLDNIDTSQSAIIDNIWSSDPLPLPIHKPSRRRRKHKKPKPISMICGRDTVRVSDNGCLLSPQVDNNGGFDWSRYGEEESTSGVCEVFGEFRQRNFNGGVGNGVVVVNEVVDGENDKVREKEEVITRTNSSVELERLQTQESLDWERLMADHHSTVYPLLVESSPIKYFLEEMCSGYSLKSTTTLGSEKERERVYDTIFRLPWRCELLIDVGFFVCLNSFLSLLTIMPMRALMMLWRVITRRQLKKLSPAELSDFGCLTGLVGGVALLECTDISLIYHMIRGQGTVKLYVVYNVLEIFDKLWQSFGGDVFQTLFSSADELAYSSPDSSIYWIHRYITDLLLAVAASIIHSFILLAQAITLSTCIVAHNNALLALLVSNNFAEIKSNVFKRFSKDNIHSIVYSDSIERFHITAFLLFVLAQNIQEAEGPWFRNFLSNAFLVYFSEVVIDIIKHSFIAKFNDIKPTTYSEFLEELCKQTLKFPTDGAKRCLTFVPIAPACVVIRVMTPVYTARLPCSPIPWRLFWMVFLAASTYMMLASLKMMIGMGLHKHAAWYVKRCQNRKLHSD